MKNSQPQLINCNTQQRLDTLSMLCIRILYSWTFNHKNAQRATGDPLIDAKIYSVPRSPVICLAHINVLV